MRLINRYFEWVHHRAVAQRKTAQLTMLETGPLCLLMDCGCHSGMNALNMAKQIDTPSIFGLEHHPGMVKVAKENGVEVIQANLNEPLPLKTNAIDVLTVTDVIEHLVEPSLFAQEAFRVIKPNGYAVIDVPNLASWHNVFALIIGLQPFSGPHLGDFGEFESVKLVGQMHKDMSQALAEFGWAEKNHKQKMYRHIVVPAYRSLLSMLQTIGFVIERVETFGYYPFPPPLADLLCRFDPWHSHHILIKVRKPESWQ